MWGASMHDHKPPGWRRLSPHGWVHGVSSSEVRRSATRATEHEIALCFHMFQINSYGRFLATLFPAGSCLFVAGAALDPL